MFEHKHRQKTRRDRRGKVRVIRLPDGPVPLPTPASRHWAMRAAAILTVTLAIASCGLL